jgi:SAM-dependent methyltransferase
MEFNLKEFINGLFNNLIKKRKKKKENPERIFREIYKNKIWGEKGDFFSGQGALPENTLKYRKFIENFIKEKKIKNAVDLGCGDFRVSKHINWGESTYLGVDVVPSLIKRNNKLYSNKNIKFIKKNIIEENLPDADLCIIKEVFQHLPNGAILKILKKIKKYRYVIITDSIVKNNENNLNKEIKMGGGREGMFLESPPFNQKIKRIIKYKRKDCPKVFKIVLMEN